MGIILTIANKTLLQKPPRENAGLYWNGIVYRNVETDLEGFCYYLFNGYTTTYQFKDNVFKRTNEYQANNYLGTQYICVDLDKKDIDPKTFYDKVKYKPTIFHTTFLNKTEEKKYKWSYHFIYVLDKTIYGEDNYKSFFEALTEGYYEETDEDARDCHRGFYSTNSRLPYFMQGGSGKIYNVDDFNIPLDPPRDFTKPLEEKEEKTLQKKDFHLDDDFFNYMNSHKRSEFVNYYDLNGYPHYEHSVYPESMFLDSQGNYKGYADLRNVPYYVVPTAQYRWNQSLNRPTIDIVQIGNRSTMLRIDAIAFMKIIPDITKEHLVCCLIREFYRHFDNSDKKYTNKMIIDIAKDIWNNIDKYDISTVKRTFQIDYMYWYNLGITDWKKVSGIIRGLINGSDYGELYDFSKTLEYNVEYFHSMGKKTCIKTLRNWLERNNMEYITEKDLRNSTVKNIYFDDTIRSDRDIARIYKEQTGKQIDHKTVNKILSEIR